VRTSHHLILPTAVAALVCAPSLAACGGSGSGPVALGATIASGDGSVRRVPAAMLQAVGLARRAGSGRRVRASAPFRLITVSKCKREHGVPSFPEPIVPSTDRAMIRVTDTGGTGGAGG